MGMGMLGAMAGAGQAIEGVGKQMFASSLEQDRQNFLIEKQRMLATEAEDRQVARVENERKKIGGLLSSVGKGSVDGSGPPNPDGSMPQEPMSRSQKDQASIQALQDNGYIDHAIKLKQLNSREETSSDRLANMMAVKMMQEDGKNDRAGMRNDTTLRGQDLRYDSTTRGQDIKGGGGAGSKSGGGSNSLAQEKWDVAKTEKFIKSQPQFYMLPNEMGNKKIKNEVAFGTFNTLARRLGGEKAAAVMQQAYDNATADADAGEGEFSKNYASRMAAISKKLSGGK